MRLGEPTLALLCLTLLVRPPVHAGLEDLILTLKLVLELVLELAHFAHRILVDVHGAVTILDGFLL